MLGIDSLVFEFEYSRKPALWDRSWHAQTVECNGVWYGLHGGMHQEPYTGGSNLTERLSGVVHNSWEIY